MRKPRWDYWRQMLQVNVWEGVALSCNVDPRQKDDGTSLESFRRALRYVREAQETIEQFERRCEIAESNIAGDLLETTDFVSSRIHRRVKLSVLASWATSLKWPVEPEFAELASDVPVREEFAFDPSSNTYPHELDIAFTAWWATSRFPKAGISPKQQIREWLDANYKTEKLSNEAKERISIVCNWRREGGKPKT
jgi:hypothetical protein